MVNQNQKRAIVKTAGAVCVAIGLASMAFFIFGHDQPPTLGALICVAVGIILMTLSKRR